MVLFSLLLTSLLILGLVAQRLKVYLRPRYPKLKVTLKEHKPTSKMPEFRTLA
jgi:hypothetical protein